MARQIDPPSILTVKTHDAPSVFQPENLLREARRQRGLPATPVPAVCVLDPDGDLVRALRAGGRSRRAAGWACYHTEMDETEHAGITMGIVGLAVGAPFAVLVAEQVFVSGCRLLLSMTSAGQVVPMGPPPYFVLIDRALRDEGTSHHYLPPSTFADADAALANRTWAALAALPLPSTEARPGPRTRHIAKRRKRSARPARMARLRWKWRLRRSTHSHRRAGATCCVSLMSQTRWPSPRAISKRVSGMARAMRSTSSPRRPARAGLAEGEVMPMLTLYLAPGASSMAPHIALHEVGAPFESRPLSFHRKENRDPTFLAINPEGKVPTLLIDGRPLTEVAGILFYLARRFPEAGLLPTDDLEAEARVVSWMSFIAATVHPARRQGLEHSRRVFAIAEQRLGDQEWAVGRYSIADIHLFRLFWRFRGALGAEPGELPHLSAHYERMTARPAVRKTIEIEAALGYELPA